MSSPFKVGDDVCVIFDNKIQYANILKVNKKTVKLMTRYESGEIKVPLCRIKHLGDDTVCIYLLVNDSQQWYDGEDLQQFRAPAAAWFTKYSIGKMQVFAERNKDKVTATTQTHHTNTQVTFLLNKNWK